MRQPEGSYDNDIAIAASLGRVRSILSHLKCEKIFVKELSPNDNSKNQLYFGPHLADIAFLPTGELAPSATTSRKNINRRRRIKYQASLNLSWVDSAGETYDAPHAKLIYYPQYPEVRFSGFLRGSRVCASKWMDPNNKGRTKGRWLILGVTSKNAIYAYLAVPNSRLAKELKDINTIDMGGALQQVITIQRSDPSSTKALLTKKLRDIHNRGWITGIRMHTDGSTSRYSAQNGGGYTLEALLGIRPNGFSGPDYLGWEVKAFGVTRFPAIGSKPTTLMTPQPDGGLYTEQGAEQFVRKFGYADQRGVPDRLNFGGRHLFGKRHQRTGLTLQIAGFNAHDGRITDGSGAVALLDDFGNTSASWSFAKLLTHWTRKHSQAVYVACLRQNSAKSGFEYKFSRELEVGTGTDFEMLLASIAGGNIYYDPGVKLEYASTAKPRLKQRSQFRINHKNLSDLYKSFEYIDTLKFKGSNII